MTSIGEYAFKNCEKLTSIIIPKSVTSIGDGVFWGCRLLTNIDIPESVTSIGDEAFKNCENLTKITIPDSVRCAFPYCLDLTQNVTVIILPKDCKVADSAFDKYIHDHKVEHTYKVAEALFKTRNYTEAVKCYQEVVEQTYTVGKCVTIKKRKIMFHHVESVYPMAQCCLGYCYYKGKGVKKDYEKAVYWFEKAKPWISGMGSEVACPICRVMSKCYKKGRGVLKDLNKAKEWESIFLVARINGKVVAKKETEAIDFSKLK